MSVITTLIPAQSFETVRDKIGAILADEVHNQSVLDNNNPDLDAIVWIERLVPFDKTELPAINVMLSNGKYDGQTIAQHDGTYNYNIDVHTSAKSTANNNGDKLAMLKLQRLLGIVRAIIHNPKYVRLGFAAPFIIHRGIETLQISDPQINGDALHSVMGRLVLSVKVPETAELSAPVAIAGNTTAVKLQLTDNGFKYVFTV
jgi:hypothetical protein